ncbi:MAG: hypothetical protein CND86_00715, partial [Bacteroidetes bacterium MED-G21]
LTLFVSNGDVIFDSNGTPYTVSGSQSESGGSLTRIAFTSSVQGVFTNGNSYTSNIASCAIEGCTESTAQNYMSDANTDDGSCVVFGCMDESASNFNSIANNEDDSCLYPGCTDPNYLEYDENANTDDGSCSCVSSVEISVTTTYEEPFEAVVSVVGDHNLYSSGITGDDLMAIANYNYEWEEGQYCFNYGDPMMCDEFANILNSEISFGITGDDLMAIANYTYEWEEGQYCFNYGDPMMCYEFANILNSEISFGGSNFEWSNDEGVLSTSEEFILSTPGEYTLSLSQNGCETLNQNFVVISGEVVSGCTNSTAINYNEEANSDDGSCIIEGCTDSIALNYNPSANQNDNLCQYILGCTDSTAYNFDAVATQDDGSCVSIIFGCTDSTAFNFDSQANTDDGACLPKIFGCTDQSASNFNSIANTDDGLCIPYVQLPEGWSMFGYTCLESLDVVDAFSEISASIEIVKDEWGLAYLPAWGFSAFDNLEFGEGYQIKMIENVTDFEFCTTIAGGASQNELDAAYAEGAASVIPEDGISQSDVEDAYADGVASVEIPEFERFIGDYYQGGYILQINEDGTGLVVDIQDLGVFAWYIAIEEAESATSQGYDDWYLPSKEELELMYNTIGQNGPQGNRGVFENDFYWSSSQYYDNNFGAWGVDFSGGGAGGDVIHNSYRVRVIRAF